MPNKRVNLNGEGWGRNVRIDDGWPWDEYDEMFPVGDEVRHAGGTPTVKKWNRRMKPSARHHAVKPAREEIFWRWYLDELRRDG